ncbi:MAG: hypothetical protein QM796_08260 [Chthoniobacteraceae bacterium]
MLKLTKQEIKLVVFVLLAILVGVVVKHYREQPVVPIPTMAGK